MTSTRTGGRRGDAGLTAFVAYTPYHLLLAQTLADQLSLRPALVLADESGLVRRFPSLVGDSAFSAVLEIATIRAPDTGRTRTGTARAAVYRRNARRIRAFVRSRPLERAFIATPVRPESRTIARLARGRPLYYEDGLEAYIRSKPLTWRRRWMRAASSLASGVLPLPETDFVAALPFEAGYALLPSHVRVPEGRARIPLDPIDRDAMRRVLRRWETTCGMPTSARYEALVILDRFAAPNEAKAAVDRVAEHVACSREQILVKAHPLDDEVDDALRTSGASVADRLVPSELALSQVRPGGRVFGGASSGLLTSAFLRPDLTVVPTHPARLQELSDLVVALAGRERLDLSFVARDANGADGARTPS